MWANFQAFLEGMWANFSVPSYLLHTCSSSSSFCFGSSELCQIGLRMGGADVVRGVTKLMGAVTAAMAGNSEMSKKSVAFCHAPPRDLREAQSSMNLPVQDAPEMGPSKWPSDDNIHHFRMEDWEYPILDDCDQPLNNYDKNDVNQLVYVPPPSPEEVEEATKDLHAALQISRPESPLLVEDNHTAGLIKNREQEVIPYTVPVPVKEEKGVDKPLLSSLPVVINEDKALDTRFSSSLPICVSLLTGGNNSVYKAFHLLQTNPKVQDAVKSLAQDPAVWKAVLSNEKVMELTQSLNEGDDGDSQKKSIPSKEYQDGINITKITAKVCDFVSGRIMHVMEKVTEIVGFMFSSVENTLCSKETASTVDRTVASCMMLAVAVLLVVLVKRVAVK